MIPTCKVSCDLAFGIIPQDQHGRLQVFLDANPLHVLLDRIQDHLLHETWKQSHTASHPAMLLLSLSLQKEAQAVGSLFAQGEPASVLTLLHVKVHKIRWVIATGANYHTA